jgi:hypothetical protein
MEGVIRPRLTGWYRSVSGAVRGIARGRQQPVERGEVLAPPSSPIGFLEGFLDVPVLQPGLRFYLDLIERREGFAFVKRTHGFWDGLVFLSDCAPEIGARVNRGEAVEAARVRAALNDVNIVEFTERRSYYVNHFREHFYTELVEDLQRPLAIPAYIEATSFRGYPNSGVPLAYHPVERLRGVHRSFHTSGRKAHDALVWKQAILDGSFSHVVKAIAQMPVLVVGPPHLSSIGHRLGLREFHHIVIPLSGAPRERLSLLGRCTDALKQITKGGRPGVVLCQASALAFWLIYRLFSLRPRSFHLDVGRCLDVWFPEVVGQQPWFVQNREGIIANMQLEHLYS